MKQALRGRAPLGASWWLLLMRLRTMGSTCSMSWAAAPQSSLDMQMQTRVEEDGSKAPTSTAAHRLP